MEARISVEVAEAVSEQATAQFVDKDTTMEGAKVSFRCKVTKRHAEAKVKWGNAAVSTAISGAQNWVLSRVKLIRCPPCLKRSHY